MDISVDRLNNRLGMQLPAELPLGLVFVTGLVDRIDLSALKGASVEFVMGEAGYLLRCVLHDPSVKPEELRRGMAIRAGGHLLFDPSRADYYLIARDVAVVEEPEVPEGTELLSTLDGLERPAATPFLSELERRASLNGLAPAEMPVWVESIAPPSVRAEMGKAQLSAEIDALSPDDDLILDEDLIAAISAALDGESDIELTREFLGQYASGKDSAETRHPYTPIIVERETTSSGGTNWMIGLLVLNMLLLTLILGAILYFLIF